MRHLKWIAWVSVLVAVLAALSGCSALRLQPAPDPEAASKSDGMLVSGRYTTKQGTMRWLMEYHVHADGRVTHVLSVEGTDRFADFWRERYPQISSESSEFTYVQEEAEGRMKVKATRVFESVDLLNQSGMAHLRLLDSPLFRSLVFKSETGSYDPEGMVDVFGNAEQGTAEDWATFLRSAVTVAYVVRDEVSGRTYSWDKTAGEIGEGASVVIQGKQWHMGAFVGGGVVGLILLFVLYMGSFGRRHWATAE